MAKRMRRSTKRQWRILQNGIAKLINKLEGVSQNEFGVDEYMDIHSTVYTMCNQDSPHNYSHQIYDKYRQSLEEYITSKVLPALRKQQDEFMLRELMKWWGNYTAMIRYLSNMFFCLDDTFVRQNKLHSLRKVGFICFRELVYYSMRSNLKNAVIRLIDREREGEQIDRTLLKNILDFFLEIGIDSLDSYKDDFEVHLLQDTETYYSRKAALWISEKSCPEYLLKAEECLKHEKDRIGYYLHSSTEHKLLEKVKTELLSRYEIQLLEKEDSGCHALLNAGKGKDLSRMYRLFSTIPEGLEPIANIFSQQITSKGKTLIKWSEDALKDKVDMRDTGSIQEQYSFVHEVMELHDIYKDFVEHAFENNECFINALAEAFGIICNAKVAGITGAELLATFFNTVLESGASGKMNDDQIDSEMEKVVKLVRYIDDKDLFSEFCRAKLARRLLFNKNANESQERSLLSKLRLQCHAQVTSKMQGMLNDFALAQETQASFHDISKKNLGIDFSVTVLNAAMWPTFELSQLNLPSEMVTCVDVFRQFYSAQHNTRKLRWIYSLGTCDIMCKFVLKIIEITGTTYQAAMLLLLNDLETFSYEDIKVQLNLPDEDVEKVLHSVTCTSYKILLKRPINKTVSPGDRFKFNHAFTHQLNRIKLPLPVGNAQKKVTETVEKDRVPAIEAAIVRIMKSRRVLHRQELLSECVQQLQGIFKPNVEAIKKGIDALMTRDLLEKDKENPHFYRYVA